MSVRSLKARAVGHGVLGTSCAVFSGCAAGSSLLMANLAQFGTLVIWPFSQRACLWLNRRLADLWWGGCVLCSRMQGISLSAAAMFRQK